MLPIWFIQFIIIFVILMIGVAVSLIILFVLNGKNKAATVGPQGEEGPKGEQGVDGGEGKKGPQGWQGGVGPKGDNATSPPASGTVEFSRTNVLISTPGNFNASNLPTIVTRNGNLVTIRGRFTGVKAVGQLQTLQIWVDLPYFLETANADNAAATSVLTYGGSALCHDDASEKPLLLKDVKVRTRILNGDTSGRARLELGYRTARDAFFGGDGWFFQGFYIVTYKCDAAAVQIGAQ